MPDAGSGKWEAVKTVLTLASVVIAALALWQTHTTSKKQDELATQTFALQKQAAQRSQSSVYFGFIQVVADNGPDTPAHYFPPDDVAQFTVVPMDAWASAKSRYVQFVFANRGTASVYVDSVGVGINADKVANAKQGFKWCKDKAETFSWTENCPRELPASAEFMYSIELTRDILTSVQQDWQSKGFEVCVRVEAYGVSCERSWAILPEGFLDAIR